MNATRYEKPTIDLKRFKWVFVTLGIIFAYYAFQLFQYQIVNGADYVAQAEDNRTTVISDPTERGMILDRNGIVLARNTPSYNVTITPAQLPDPDDNPGDRYRILSELAATINVPLSAGIYNEETARGFTPCATDFGIQEIVEIASTNWPYLPTRIRCNIPRDMALVVREKAMDWPGVAIEVESIREYPTGINTSEVIGFLGPVPEALLDYYTELGFVSGRDKVGYAGIENSMQDVLGGSNGQRVVEVAVDGQVIRNLEEPIPPQPGANVYLTIDARLQEAARTALKSNFDYWNTRAGHILSESGVVIAMNPKTGEILAMVNEPSFENNRMSRFIPGYYYNQLSIDEAKPMLNKAISSELPPGSVYKLVSALGVLNEGVVTPEQTIEDPGTIYLKQSFLANDPGSLREYVCWTADAGGHGSVDYLHGIAWSCNIYWYKVGGGYQDEVPGNGLGIMRMDEYARALGYGQLTNIELPGEADGLVPSPDWKRFNIGENWATGDTYLAAVGQGFVLATPLQVVNSIATIANGGEHMQVTLVNRIVEPDGTVVKELEPTVLWDITKDPKIHTIDGNQVLDEVKTVQPWIIELAKRGMEMVTETGGTAAREFEDYEGDVAGKTGTAEYCDDFALSLKLCGEGINTWPAHAWFVGYEPADDPDIVVVAFVYNGREGSTFSAPIVAKVLDTWKQLKEIDAAKAVPVTE
ncbi:MAG: penicillin-binding protein 2 [Anaerolineaceae bacterium]